MNSETNIVIGYIESFHKTRVAEMVEQLVTDHIDDGLAVASVAEYLERFVMSSMPYHLIYSGKSLRRVDFEELARFYIYLGSQL